MIVRHICSTTINALVVHSSIDSHIIIQLLHVTIAYDGEVIWQCIKSLGHTIDMKFIAY